jgi:hypothetical protein
MTAITLRFVTSPHDPLSALIRLQAGLCMPFTPSHVEALSRDGAHYVGQHLDGGMQARPIGYDGQEIQEIQEKLVQLPCPAEHYDRFQSYCEGRIGAPYDWTSIVGFVDPAWNLHAFNHLICSAEMTAGLRHCGYFSWPLTVPFHHISPRDLLLILSSHLQIDH